MSSTYSVAKRAFVMAAPNGDLFYLLDEQTFESNLSPHIAHWCTIWFGPAAEVMPTVVRWSTACEGGCLKERGGDTTPSAYIKHWREALAQPLRLVPGRVSGQFAETLQGIEERKRPAVEAVLAKAGISVVDGKFAFELDDRPDVLAQIVQCGVAPWQLVSRPSSWAEPANWAAVPLAPSKAAEPLFDAHWIQDDTGNRIYWFRTHSGAHGHWRISGWDSSTMTILIKELAIASEYRSPGSAEDCIRKIRARLKLAPQLAPNRPIRIDASKATERWHAQQAKELFAKLGVEAGGVVVTTPHALVTTKATWPMRSLPDECFDFPEHESAPKDQTELFAA